MLDKRLFTPLPVAERRALDASFLAYANVRDGEPNVARRTLAHRERWCQEISTRSRPAWNGERIHPQRFERWHLGRSSLADAPRLARWLGQLAHINEGEEWGVNYLLGRGGFQGLGNGRALKPRDFADLEETYHTRVLRMVVQLFGVDFTLREPPAPVRLSVKMMARLPERPSFLLLAAGELMGTVNLLRLMRVADELFAHHREMHERTLELLDEILIDEIGHVTYLLASMGRLGLALVRRLALVYLAGSHRGYGGRQSEPATAVIRDGLENYNLGLFPERVLRRAFVPAQYWPAELTV